MDNDKNPQDPTLDQSEPSIKMALISMGCVVGLALVWAVVQPTVHERGATNASKTMLDTLKQAESRLTTHFSNGDFSGLDNEVLRQVAFSGQGKPVSPTQPLWVRGGSMGLGAMPIQEGKGFSLIVDNAGKRECERIVAAYSENPVQINARSGDHTLCIPHDNLIRIDVTPE